MLAMHLAEICVGPYRVYAAAIQVGDLYQPAVAVRDKRLPAQAAPVFEHRSPPMADAEEALRHALALGEFSATNRAAPSARPAEG